MMNAKFHDRADDFPLPDRYVYFVRDFPRTRTVLIDLKR